MRDQWDYQIRINFADEFADVARSRPDDAALKPLADILRLHDATMKCQLDAFAEYVAEAERQGPGQFPLYKWTKVTIEDPAKRATHLRSFALHVAGKEVYGKEIADALELDLKPLAGGALITRLSRHDTNPANNLQVPAHLRA